MVSHDSRDFAAEPDPRNAVGVLSLQREIPSGGSAEFAFLLAWRFPTGHLIGAAGRRLRSEKTVIGNHYCTSFPEALAAAEYAIANLERANASIAEAFPRKYAARSTVKEAASANLSTLASTTCFRTADGEFHGFEGVNDHNGCCFGNCTHVWNYESATPHLFRHSRGHSGSRRWAIPWTMQAQCTSVRYCSRWCGTLRFRRRRWPDGSDCSCVPRLVTVRRHGIASTPVASHPERPGVPG